MPAPTPPDSQVLPLAAPHGVLALGAYLKNRACALAGDAVRWSALHGDLADPAACVALEASAEALLAALPQPPAAVAHDLHPDFHSTRLAHTLAARLHVPAVAVQHHHAHLALVAAEHGLVDEPLLGWALDGVGLGLDGHAWGGELLWLDAASRSTAWHRVAHLPPLALPGGDRAAREPWRMAAALLHALGRGDEIVPRFSASVGADTAATVQRMLARTLNCPPTTAGGRWFDAAAAALGLHARAQRDAEAAMALEAEAARWLAAHAAPPPASTLAELPTEVAALFDLPAERRGEAAARFHLRLADALAHAAAAAALEYGVRCVVLGGGCFANRVLSQRLAERLDAAGLRVLHPGTVSGCGDAGLALGQAWVAAWAVERGEAPHRAGDAPIEEPRTCASRCLH